MSANSPDLKRRDGLNSRGPLSGVEYFQPDFFGPIDWPTWVVPAGQNRWYQPLPTIPSKFYYYDVQQPPVWHGVYVVVPFGTGNVTTKTWSWTFEWPPTKKRPKPKPKPKPSDPGYPYPEPTVMPETPRPPVETTETPEAPSFPPTRETSPSGEPEPPLVRTESLPTAETPGLTDGVPDAPYPTDEPEVIVHSSSDSTTETPSSQSALTTPGITAARVTGPIVPQPIFVLVEKRLGVAVRNSTRMAPGVVRDA